MAQVRQKFGLTMTELNLGGGYGIKYVQAHDPLDYGSFIQAVSKVVYANCERLDFPVPFILMEPGRSIVAPAGITLYTIGSVKEIKGVRTYVAVDGGMTDNPRYALYGSEYEAVLADRPEAERTKKVTIAGRCCESGDILIKDIMLPDMAAGDLLAVMATGAYNYSMASHYNRVPNPPVILVRDGDSAVIIRRETYEDLIRNDLSYPFRTDDNAVCRAGRNPG
jgi:diaminopimelate decarboxylase